MAAVDYKALLDEVKRILTDDARVGAADPSPTHVTLEPELPTVELCPAVLIGLATFSRAARRLVGGLSAGTPYDEEISIPLDCWAFSLQGAGDATRQLYDLVQNVMLALDDNHQLGALVDWADVVSGDARFGQTESGGLFAAMTLTIRATVQA